MTAPKRRDAATPKGDPPATDAEVAGLVVTEAATTRTGEDTRRRGWFWHWNSIVTQYAPLLGLKGVGLLNSYTVWTDRREESPHRGYAFPSQQSEADFYGEDRAELITINKILVALDLIEIRKEMVLRVDPQGRRWRVPHNFYRVKDHSDGFSLTAREVLLVAQLADRDKAVYRYVRRLFSPRFSPIDGENVWHAILAEVRQTELWQRLAARTERDEHRASARTKAGHAARRATGTGTGTAASVADAGEGLLFVPNRGDEAATTGNQNDSATGGTPQAESTSVAGTNNGSELDVEPGNTGLDQDPATIVAPANQGQATAVAQANTTYHQSLTTTTTTVPDETRSSEEVVRTPRPSPIGGPDGATPPTDAPGEAAAIRAFAEANSRPATPAERKLLRGLAERFSANADDPSEVVTETGWNRVTAGIYEAVESGSAFVAPRRLREILRRWERDGYPQSDDDRRLSPAPVAAPARRTALSPPATTADLLAHLDHEPDIPLPHGHGGRRTWEFVVTGLATAIERTVLADLIAGTSIAAYHDGEVQIAVPGAPGAAARAEQLATTYRDLIERKLSAAMRRPVRLAVITPDDADQPRPAAPVRPAKQARPERPATSEPDDAELTPPGFVIAECGLWSDQLWAAVLAELERHDVVGRADFEAWLRSTLLLGRAGDGGPGTPVVVGVPHALAQRRVSSRFQAVIAGVLSRVVGAPLPVEIVVARDWLAQHQPPAHDDETERAVGA